VIDQYIYTVYTRWRRKTHAVHSVGWTVENVPKILSKQQTSVTEDILFRPVVCCTVYMLLDVCALHAVYMVMTSELNE